jgi:DNA-binding CsgD family transcriptional regulator
MFFFSTGIVFQAENSSVDETGRAGAVPDIEMTAREVARNKANVARWGVNSVVFLFALLIIIIVLVSQDVNMLVITAVAAVGLGYVWYTGWKRGRLLYHSFFEEEMTAARRNVESYKEESASPQLTAREMQVLNCIARGYANKQIALELGISENTVKHFSSRVMTKLNASGRTDAAVIAIRNGLIDIDSEE